MKERTYRFFTGTPLWGFGHGLSYTSYAYSGLAAKGANTAAPVEVRVTVRNSGARAGEEVVQAYLVPPAQKGGSLTSPVLQRQLVGFQRVALAPGKAQKLTFTLDPRSISVVARDGTRQVVPGAYRLWVGGGQPGDGPGQWAGFTLSGDAQELPK
jgi:beta-glucosidase